jgi:isocitrate lyase
MGAARLWHLLKTAPYVNTLGSHAAQQVKAGRKEIYLSGWQVATDANTAGQVYPGQSLYPVDSLPHVVGGFRAFPKQDVGLRLLAQL